MFLNELVVIIKQQLFKDDKLQKLMFMIKHNIVCNENSNGFYKTVTNFADDKIDLLKSLVKDIQKRT